ncbi:MAG: twin-arginine translocase subunit TatC [Wenzhouxiangellaceae bacterium]
MNTDSTDQEMSLIEHLVELRNRLMRAMLAILLATLALMPFSRQLYAWVAEPLMRHLPEGSSMIAIDVAAPFFTPFKLTMMMGVFLSIPVLIYQLWAFVAPGLYEKEKHLAKPLLVSSTLLFYAGCAFAYYVVFPVVFAFFTGMAPADVSVMTDISRYLDFILTLFFAFGIAFEVPIAIIILVALGVMTPDALAEKRPYVIVGAFAIGMLLTPPDMISQTLLAVPMWLLYEAGIVAARLLIRRDAGDDIAEANSD